MLMLVEYSGGRVYVTRPEHKYAWHVQPGSPAGVPPPGIRCGLEWGNHYRGRIPQ